jgi:hypothetical protein
VLDGQCVTAATLAKDHVVVQLNNSHELSFGGLSGTLSDRVRAIVVEMAGAAFDSHLSDQIVQEMWEKWVFRRSPPSWSARGQPWRRPHADVPANRPSLLHVAYANLKAYVRNALVDPISKETTFTRSV